MVFRVPHPFEEARILPFKALLLLSEIKRKKHWLYQHFTKMFLVN